MLGEAACLAAALLWAVAVTAFRPAIQRHGARTVNLAKCVLGAVLQGLTVFALGQAGYLAEASARALVFLGLSGIVGLTLGDTALFGAVARLGVSRTLLLQTLAPLFAALIAAVWQSERPGPAQLWGGALILAGVATVVSPSPGTPDRSPAAGRLSGFVLGALAALGQGAGVVLAKVGMAEVPVLPASALRLAVAALGLALLAASARRMSRLGGLLRSRAAMARVVPATLLGTYLALFLMMAGVSLAPAAVATVLLATSPVFALLIDRVVSGRSVPARGWVGTLVAVLGVAVLAAG